MKETRDMATVRINVETGFEVDVPDRTVKGAQAEAELFMDAVAAMEADERFPDVLESDVTAAIRPDAGLTLQVRLTIGTIDASHAVARAQAFVEQVMASIGADRHDNTDGIPLGGTGDGGDIVFDDFHVQRLVDV